VFGNWLTWTDTLRVGRPRLAFADAFDLGGVQRVHFRPLGVVEWLK
jgi:hypothetical protein